MGAKPLIHPAAKLYDEDFALWTAETARLLREGRFKEIDVEHVAEEIEDMGNRDHRELFSRLTLIIQHLLKWQAIEDAAIETSLPEDSFPPKCPCTLEQILDRNFLPGAQP